VSDRARMAAEVMTDGCRATIMSCPNQFGLPNRIRG
jgi:hypothetical protein